MAKIRRIHELKKHILQVFNDTIEHYGGDITDHATTTSLREAGINGNYKKVNLTHIRRIKVITDCTGALYVIFRGTLWHNGTFYNAYGYFSYVYYPGDFYTPPEYDWDLLIYALIKRRGD